MFTRFLFFLKGKSVVKHYMTLQPYKDLVINGLLMDFYSVEY
jgi:hypothetical protein